MNHVLHHRARGDSSWLVPVPDLEGDVLATAQLTHEVLVLLADWEQRDPDRATNPETALPARLAGGVGAAALNHICTACRDALTDAAQPLTPTRGRLLDPVGWAHIPVEVLAASALAAHHLADAHARLPHGSAWAEEAITAVAADRGHRPAAVVMGGVRLYRALTLKWDRTLADLARRLPAGAGSVTLDRAGHIAYSTYAARIHDIWFDNFAPYSTLEFNHPRRTTGSPRGARPSRTNPVGERPR